MKSIDELEKISKKTRREIIQICEKTNSGHVGPALSVVDILVVLYEKIIRGDVNDPERDRVILSKGHACSALYVVLKNICWLPEDRFNSFATDGCRLGHHPHLEPEIGLEANTGSLGHGLPLGCGLAYSAKLINSSSRTYIISSDGEMNEGSVWEAASFAAHNRLNNLCLIIDANKIQAMGFTKDILNPLSYKGKLIAFGWETTEIDGHSIEQILKAMNKVGRTKKPYAIVANTIKGKGVSFMENNILWHYRPPQGDEFEAAMKELSQ